MRKNLIFVTITTLLLSVPVFAQTIGTLSFSFTPISKSPCYEATKSVMAVWIESSTGTFIKTKLRYCCAGDTKDHLPTWSVKAGGTATNSSKGNTTDATTGATLTSFTAKSFVWDGNNVNGTSNGTVVADGTYQVRIEETWNHGTTATAVRSFTFTKGSNIDHQTPVDDANFKNITLDWIPKGLSVNEMDQVEGVNLYPNPSNDGIFNIEFEQATQVQVVNLLGVVIYDSKVAAGVNIHHIDLTNTSNGIYFVHIFNNEKSSKRKILLNK